MSKWRLQGFVQDSDEEAEDLESLRTPSQTETQHASDERVEDADVKTANAREDGDAGQTQNTYTEDSGVIIARQTTLIECSPNHHSTSSNPPLLNQTLPLQPTKLRPSARVEGSREPTESPDPLQSLPIPNRHRIENPFSSSQSLGAPAFSQLVTTSPSGLSTTKTSGNSLLAEFGIAPLLESSESDLSDPPSDIETDQQNTIFASPKRRTNVKVVIPLSKISQHGSLEERARRSFRERKPIQLHPYVLEGERYRRELQGRGIRPVPRATSPLRADHNAPETQEPEFDPQDDRYSSSPPEIPVSTPTIRRLGQAHHESSIRQAQSSPKSHKYLPSIPHVASGFKRRKLDRSETQAALPRRALSQHREELANDTWDIPQSPPYSSSPVFNGANFGTSVRAGPIALAPELNVLTPSHSSSLDVDAHLRLESDSEPVVHNTHGSTRRRRRIITIPDDSPSSEKSSESESGPSETELRRVGRRIKGVLPASWLHLDRQAQDKRRAPAYARSSLQLSPQKGEPQRGVAQRVTKASGSMQSTARSSPAHAIPHEPEKSLDVASPCAMGIQKSAQVVHDMAALLDRRYADEDSDNMEDDPLHLFTLSGPNKKRKNQTKVTDTFAKVRKAKMHRIGSKAHASSARALAKSKSSIRKVRHALPPAMSVMDFEQSPPGQNKNVPDFLRIARRQASRRSDYARQRPAGKLIKLHTAHDTEDANRTLRQWQGGALKPKLNVRQLRKQPIGREPLTALDCNQQRSQWLEAAAKWPHPELQEHTDFTSRDADHRQRRKLPQALLLFRRDLGSCTGSFDHNAASSKTVNNLRHTARLKQKPQPYRTTQLEGLEIDLGRIDRRAVFEKGLQQVNRHFTLQAPLGQLSAKPQLARFLASDAVDLPPVPSAHNVGEEPLSSPTKRLGEKQHRLYRKAKPRRIDVNAREYRQPSEPALQDVFDDVPFLQDLEVGEIQEQGRALLQGLGPYGTKYSTTFDVSLLEAGTYFHPSTFLGGSELDRALQTGRTGKRDLDDSVGYCTITCNAKTVRCGPWADETFSLIANTMETIWHPLDSLMSDEDPAKLQAHAFEETSKTLRSLINYFSTHLSFLDPVDRQMFATKMLQFIESLLHHTLSIAPMNLGENKITTAQLHSIRTQTYLLCLTMQVWQITQHPVVDPTIPLKLSQVLGRISIVVITQVLSKIPELGRFLEQNKLFKIRETGIQDSGILVESVVICMHVLETSEPPRLSFWDLVSQTLSPRALKANHLKDFESLWATLFTLLPFVEMNESGILDQVRRSSFRTDNWNFVRDLLKRLFALYPSTYSSKHSSLNDYIRAILTRCHALIKFWHWERCESMLNVVFDFFGKNGLKQLRGEENNRSASFIEQFVERPSLNVAANDISFHVFLKCLALGLTGMRKTYPEKKIRSIVFRLTPNHGRSYPKDQPLDTDSLDALRNHHDLLCTLYWASPPTCRPKLDLLRSLVHHENSHREACRLNVRAWANLATFQLSTQEPYTSVQPFAEWHKEMMLQTLRQYRLAKMEADEYLKSGALDDSDTVSRIVRQTMEKNQEQVIATLRDCITGMHKAVQTGISKSVLREFLVDSGLVQLLELPHFEDPRLVAVIRDTLKVLRVYATHQPELSSKDISQQTNEESQDYGQFPDIDDLDEVEQYAPKQAPLDFIQIPLWRLLSNAFGAEIAPNDNLLMDCIDTWALVASHQVSSGARQWSYYIDPPGPVSWQQLRRTEQAQKFGPYFLSTVLSCDPTAYTGNGPAFTTSLLLCLADRESMLRFQHHLLNAIVRVDSTHPLLDNIPFFQDDGTGKLDITAETLRTRRLALISSILANMRDDLTSTIRNEPSKAVKVKEDYAAMLKDFMTVMKGNYKQLRQGTTVSGAYVEFVQKIIQFLQQYTADICPVLDFFTNSVAFPLPAGDPTYVVGRLCGYAPKLSHGGTAKQLSIFIQTVAQQAAIDNQQAYLVSQLTTALCTDEAPAKDRCALRQVILQGILPTYIGVAFSSISGFAIAKPLLQSLNSILRAAFFDIRVLDGSNIGAMYETIVSISHAFIRSTEQLKGNAAAFRQAHVLHATTLMFEAMVQTVSLLEYIYSRWMGTMMKPVIVTYFEQFTTLIVQMFCEMTPDKIPSYTGDAHVIYDAHFGLQAFCTESLESSMTTNWSANANYVFFGQGHAKREVVVDIGTVEEERARLFSAVGNFHAAVTAAYRNKDGDGASRERLFLGEIDV